MIATEQAPADRLASALRACRHHFISVAVFSALLNLLYIAPVLYMLQVYDRVVPTQGSLTLFFLTVAVLGALATLSLLDHVRSRLLIRASMRLDRQLAGAVLDATLARPDQAMRGLSKQVVREFDILRQTLTGPGIVALFDAPWMPVYVVIGFLIHPLVGLLATFGGLLLLLLAWRNERVTRQRLDHANAAAGRAYTSHEFTAASADVVRALGMRRAMVSRHLHERETMMDLQTEASFASGRLVTLSRFVRLALQSLALGLAAWLAIGSLISPGAIFASMFLVGRALQPIDQVLGAWKGIVQARGAYRTLVDLFGEAPPDISLTQLPPPRGRLSVEDLTVFNPAGEGAILDAVSFDVQAGEVVGIVGPSGAGKSTLVRMIAGAAMPDRGTIRFDGADQKDWDPERLARHIGYMPQEAALFAGTIKDNISRFCSVLAEEPTSVDTMAVEAARLASAHELILRLPSGYDHLLGLGGRGLSAGQAQRIALARALFGSPAYLILDEPNSHLDAEGEQQLVATLGELKKQGVTMLLVAHRLSILPVIDKLLVVRDGHIDLYGPRDEVMRRIAPPQAPRAVPRTAA